MCGALVNRESPPTTGLIYGFGVDDLDYRKEKRIWYKDGSSKLLWICPIYNHWKLMLRRVFKDKGYTNCSICADWLKLSSYHLWYTANCPDLSKKWVVDKDLLSGSMPIYSPGTCLVMDQKLNMKITGGNQKSSAFPVGVYYDTARGNYQGYFNCDQKRKIKRFSTAREAHRFWQKGKIETLYSLIANNELNHLCPDVLGGVYLLISYLTQAYLSDRVTYSLKGYDTRAYRGEERC